MILKSKTIQLSKVGRKYGDLRKFREELISNLGDEIFEYPTLQILLFNVLKQITPIKRTLKLNESSIEQACGKVLQHFGLPIKIIVKKLTGDIIENTAPKERTNAEVFSQDIIEIDKVPSTIYKALLKSVNEDLIAITELIKHYEQQPCIEKYIRDGEIPKLHEQRIIYDFYKRCSNERGKILNYFLEGVKDRALIKSRYTHLNLSYIMAFTEKYYDRPYHFAQTFSIHNFDYRKIDLSGHRIREFYIDESISLQILYNENKQKFYKRYFQKTSIEQHYQNFRFYLSHLPLKHNRNQIFEELIRLFKAKRWISFYALALPQVEGIFSEMCMAIAPDKDLSQKSLTHKVNSVRPFHYLSENYFDYYQYYIPLLRNKFAHTGYDDDFKLKSYDLLVDLSHVLQLFYELENPLVKIKKLHVRRKPEDFISIEEFVSYFQLINNLKVIQRQEIKADIENFEKEFLAQYCSIDYTCWEMIQEFPNMMTSFIEKINASFNYRQVKLVLCKTNFSEVKKIFQKEPEINILKDCFLYNRETVEKLENYSFFISTHNRNLPSLNSEIKTALNQLKELLKEEIKIFDYLNTELQKLEAK